MTPETQALLERLPLTRAEFVALRGEEVLRNMLVVGAIREVGGLIQLSTFGASRLSIAQKQRPKQG